MADERTEDTASRNPSEPTQDSGGALMFSHALRSFSAWKDSEMQACRPSVLCRRVYRGSHRMGWILDAGPVYGLRSDPLR